MAGGFGTRLQSLFKDIPKPMAPIGEEPFLYYLLEYLTRQYKFENIILSTGYLHQIIEDYFQQSFNGIPIIYAKEEGPLGTGGAILNSLKFAKSRTVLIVNGDTYLELNVNNFIDFHQKNNSNLTIALKEMLDFDRYGTVKMKENKIIKFEEKKYCPKGLINAGIYLIDKVFLEQVNLPVKFSFEKDFLEKIIDKQDVYGFISDGYFIDIGIPEDYNKALNFFTGLSCN